MRLSCVFGCSSKEKEAIPGPGSYLLPGSLRVANKEAEPKAPSFGTGVNRFNLVREVLDSLCHVLG